VYQNATSFWFRSKPIPSFVSNLFFSLLSPFSRYTFLTMSDRIKEFAEIPQQFVKEGTQVRSLHLSQFGEAQ